MSYKKGFLQKEKTLKEVLVSQVPKKEQANLGERLQAKAELLMIQSSLSRLPKATSAPARYFLSLMCDALMEDYCFLIRDEQGLLDDRNAGLFVTWVTCLTKQAKVIWVTGRNPDTFREYFFPGEQRYKYCDRQKISGKMDDALKELSIANAGTAFYELIHNEVLPSNIADRLNVRLSEEVDDKLRQAESLARKMQYKEALEIYEELIEKHHNMQAMSNAARIYLDVDLPNMSREDRMERCVTLCYASKEHIVENLIIYGDYYMARFNALDSESKDGRVDYLKLALDSYDQAAKLGHVKACFNAAELLLTWKFSFKEGDDFIYNYTTTDAIPYIVKLLEYEDRGDSTAQIYVVRLMMTNRDMVNTAMAVRNQQSK